MVVEVIKATHNIAHEGSLKIFKRLQESNYVIQRKSVKSTFRQFNNYLFANWIQTVKPISVVRTKKPRERFQIDMIDLSKYSSYNRNYKWILNIIDCYQNLYGVFLVTRKRLGKCVIFLENYFISFFT